MYDRVSSVRRASVVLLLLAAGVCLSGGLVSADDFDWRNVNGVNWVSSVKDQGSAGTCWDFAACGILEAKYMLTRNDMTFQPDVCRTTGCLRRDR
jgi:C1A family cysteine protease